jgi:spore coat polysaccharide biosynthesis protein SpsF (cytidylyltransferase family)
LDYPDDLKLAEIIFEKLGNDFHVQDILKLLEKNPQLVKINEVDIDNWRENYAKLKTDFSLKQ